MVRLPRPELRDRANYGRAVVGGVGDVLRRFATANVDRHETVDAHLASSPQQVAMLRMLGRRLHSNYGPTAAQVV